MKALFTEEFHPIIYEKLKERGVACHIFSEIDADGLKEKIVDYDILIVNSKIYIGKEILDKAENLKIIGRVGSGLDVIDLKCCDDKGIAVCSSPEGNANAVAEHTIGMLLCAMNNIFISHSQILNDEWNREENRGEELFGKTIAVIGCGNVGARVVNLLQNFNVEVLVNDVLRIDDLPKYARQVEMEEIYEKSDVVSMHLQLTEASMYFADSNFFSSFVKPIYFINTSRGKIVETSSLLDNIESGKVKAALLDVYEDEPLVKNDERMEAFMSDYKLIATPHIAGWSQRSKYELCNVLADKILSKI